MAQPSNGIVTNASPIGATQDLPPVSTTAVSPQKAAYGTPSPSMIVTSKNSASNRFHPYLVPRSVRLASSAQKDVPAPQLAAELTDQPAPSPPYREVEKEGIKFRIFPNDFVEPLQIAAATDTQWQVREADFIDIEAMLKSVSDAKSALYIDGDAGFVLGASRDLSWLMTQPIGRDLVKAIGASKHHVSIKQTSDGNACDYASADSWEVIQADGSVKAGAGSDVTIHYNLSRGKIGGGKSAWKTRPPAIGLAHEMVHAWTGVYGTRALGKWTGEIDGAISTTSRRELQATGLKEFAAAVFTENKFRAAFGLPERPKY